jgi:hypothetical protein
LTLRQPIVISRLIERTNHAIHHIDPEIAVASLDGPAARPLLPGLLH